MNEVKGEGYGILITIGTKPALWIHDPVFLEEMAKHQNEHEIDRDLNNF